MKDPRSPLQAGTIVRLKGGHAYAISGEPIGYGGGSIIYPAKRILSQSDSSEAVKNQADAGTVGQAEKQTEDQIDYVIKECYPLSSRHVFIRSDSGEIVPEDLAEESRSYLDRGKQMLLSESRISQRVYRTASRMIPVREAAAGAELAFPNGSVSAVDNAYTVMDSLQNKGRSLGSFLKEYHRIPVLSAFEITRQLLSALKEIHEAGYVHLDIQDGNIFIHGQLETSDELVTLIDFGAARQLKDGKTEPIKDRVVYTTDGFSAPEAVLENDGTLQLGPETDLYSAGCLLLYMLTGEKYPLAKLLSVTDGVYLTRFKLRKIHCPAHLVDRMQAILAKALEKDREKRYRSAEEMLTDVSDFAEALKPYRSDLKSVEYDAFICYKHGPIDSEAAKTLQTQLERYRPPRGITEKKHPFRRVFVDEGELSACSDFGEQIEHALKNAGWLIVVCSSGTPDSPWVQLEIETFLKYHDPSRILAVLTEGEPEVSFPDCLKGRNMEDSPLAADARGKDLKAVLCRLKGSALLKLAAPMLSTTYDSLRQRQRTARILRRTYAGAAVLAVIIAFLFYANLQNVRLNEQYKETLFNQARYLSSLAEEKYDSLEYGEAMELALQALPSEENPDMPVLPAAQNTLTKALNLYQSDSSTLTAAGNYKTEGGASGAAFSVFADEEDGILFIQDGTLSMWDMESRKKTAELPSSGLDIRYAGETLTFLEEDRIVYADYKNIYCFDYAEQELLWTVSTDSSPGFSDLVYCEADHTLICLDQDGIHKIDKETGEEINFYSCGSDIYNDGTACSWRDSQLCISGSGKKIAWIVQEDHNSVFPENWGNSQILLLDTDAETYKVYAPEAGVLRSLQFLDEDRLILTGPKESAVPGFGYGSSLSTIDETFAALYNLSSEQLVWKQEVSNIYEFSINEFYVLEEEEGYGLFLSGNTALRIRLSDGAVQNEWTFEDLPLCLVGAENGMPQVVSRNGYVYTVSETDLDYCFSQKSFSDELYFFTKLENSYLVTYAKNTYSDNKNTVEYCYYENPAWTEICDSYEAEYGSVDEAYVSEDGTTAAVLNRKSSEASDQPILCTLCRNSSASVYILDPEEGHKIDSCSILGLYELEGRNCLLIYYRDDSAESRYQSRIWCIDPENQTEKQLSFPAVEGGNSVNLLAFCKNTVYYRSAGSDSLYRWKIGTEEAEELVMTGEIEEDQRQVSGFIINKQGTDMLLVLLEGTAVYTEDVYTGTVYTESVYRVDLQTMKTEKLKEQEEPVSTPAEYSWSRDGRYFIAVTDSETYAHKVEIFDIHGNLQGTVSCEGSSKQDVVDITDDTVFIFQSYQSADSTLSAWTLSDGSLRWELDLDTVYSLASAEIVDEQTIGLLTDGSEYFLIDRSDEYHGVLAEADQVFGYTDDRLYSIRSTVEGEYKLGWLPRYSLKEIIEKGNAAVNS